MKEPLARQDAGSLPELVFVPAHPDTRPGCRNVVFEVRELVDGRRMLPAFTSTELLVKALGPWQPWAELPLQAARALMGLAGVPLVLINPAAAPDTARWQQSDIDMLVMRSGLLDAANTLRNEAEAFKKIMPMTAPAAPDSGSAAFDGSLNTLVEAIFLLHLQIAGDLEENSGKLRAAHNNDEQTDEKASQRSARSTIQVRSNRGAVMGADGKSPSPLAPCARNWLGGDIQCLSAFSATLYSYEPAISAVVTAVDRKVGAVVHDAGWLGTKAAAFTAAWERDSIAATALGALASRTGDVVDQVAVNLSKIENALEEAADRASALGVPIGPDGKPPLERYADPNKKSWLAEYQSFWNGAMFAACRARAQAAGELLKLYAQIAAPAPGGKSGAAVDSHDFLINAPDDLLPR